MLAGRIVAAALRRLRRGGTTLPGRVALGLDAGLPGRLAARLSHGVSLVTGTNGKTTTAAMLAAILERHGRRLARNRGGANLRTGIATALLLAPHGADAALLEVDEATMPFAGGALHPRLVAVTNFFRDQLDRYGELDRTVALVARGVSALASGATVVLNADDPLAASLGGRPDLRTVHFGADPALWAGHAEGGGPSDVTRCPRCAGDLRYPTRSYAHLGDYRCARCGFARPSPEVSVAARVEPTAARPGELTLRTPGAAVTFAFALPGLYNAYNAAGAAAAALALGAGTEDVAIALSAFRSAFGRMEWLELAGHPACLALVKNPVGCSEVLRAVVADPVPGKALVVLLNDRVADGLDVSWIWDADFEALAAEQDGFAAVIAGGRRAADMALRLKYAGVDATRLRVCAEAEAAMESAAEAAAQDAAIYVLPTYTAMLSARESLVRRRLLAPFWQD